VTRVDVGDLAFRILSSAGPSDSRRAPVVLVHGIGVSHRYFERLHAALAEHGAVHSVDLPGFAGLPKPAGDVDVARMGAALAHVVESSVGGPVVLLGHSMGAQWVVEAALARPDLVDHVVAVGPVADAAQRTPFAQTAALAMDTLRESPGINVVVFTDYLRCGVPWYLAQLRHMLAYPIEQRVGLLPMPLLVVRGGRAPIAGLDWSRRLRDAAATGRLIQIPRHPHIVQHRGADALTSALLACIPLPAPRAAHLP